MDNFFAIIERFAPEAVQIIAFRYEFLRHVLYSQPVGRRQLTINMRSTERMVRNEFDLLKHKGAVASTAAGIYLTDFGYDMLREVETLVPGLFHTKMLAEKIKSRFGLRKVLIVPGDSNEDVYAAADLSRVSAEYLRSTFYPGCIVAVTGGTTLAGMARAMRPGAELEADICLVPARGGFGEKVETQAGSIVAKIAQNIGAQYRLLHIPDNLEPSTAEALKKDIHVQEVLNIIKSARILVHGIGPAEEMAERRGLSPDEKTYLQENGAQGEALRYYFNQMGKIIFEIPGIGLELDDIHHIDTIIAVAGGSNKAEAIEAVLKSGFDHVLITDEGAAQKIIYGKDD
ncbi:MAG TPA: sugar-binding domain-containing protein [Syntrophomonas sp.]|nr:sugar-binding domain-containing protein [Syntrophomonas sp.]